MQNLKGRKEREEAPAGEDCQIISLFDQTLSTYYLIAWLR